MASKPTCKYGASCYRKNPDHLKQYSHPGRDDEAETHDRDKGEEGRDKRTGRGRPRNGRKATETTTRVTSVSVCDSMC